MEDIKCSQSSLPLRGLCLSWHRIEKQSHHGRRGSTPWREQSERLRNEGRLDRILNIDREDEQRSQQGQEGERKSKSALSYLDSQR